jgi:hypothetical protein
VENAAGDWTVPVPSPPASTLGFENPRNVGQANSPAIPSDRNKHHPNTDRRNKNHRTNDPSPLTSRLQTTTVTRPHIRWRLRGTQRRCRVPNTFLVPQIVIPQIFIPQIVVPATAPSFVPGRFVPGRFIPSRFIPRMPRPIRVCTLRNPRVLTAFILSWR